MVTTLNMTQPFRASLQLQQRTPALLGQLSPKPCIRAAQRQRLRPAATAAPMQTSLSTPGGGQHSSNGTGPAAAQQAQTGRAAPVPVLPPPEAYQAAANAGEVKANLPVWKTLLMAVIAGGYIGLGGFLAIAVSSQLPGMASANPGLAKLIYGSFGLPMGLFLVLICGAELYTGNTCLLAVAAYEKRATPQQVFKNWSLSLIGNFIGAMAIVAAATQTGIIVGPAAASAVKIATAKVSLPLSQVFVRALLCNWFVCIAVWMAGAANSMTGKFLCVWLPITAFAAIGLEHSVANMFLIPIGLASGADITWRQIILHNLVPVTVANTIAGSVLMALSYSLVYGRLGKPQTA